MKTRVEPDCHVPPLPCALILRRAHICLASLIVVDFLLPPTVVRLPTLWSPEGRWLRGCMACARSPRTNEPRPFVVSIFLNRSFKKLTIVWSATVERVGTRPHGGDYHLLRKGGEFQITVSEQETYKRGRVWVGDGLLPSRWWQSVFTNPFNQSHIGWAHLCLVL